MHWETARAGARELANVATLRGRAYELKRDYPAAIAAYHEALALDRTLSSESAEVSTDLSDLADAEQSSGDLEAAARDYREALRVARAVGYTNGIATFTSNVAISALQRKVWPEAESLAREALALSEKIGRQDLIASNCRTIARALVQQLNRPAALAYARRALDIYDRLGMSTASEAARLILEECGN